MTKPTAAQCHAMFSYFVKATSAERLPNRNKARWWWEAILMDNSKAETEALIDYYVNHWERLDMEWFAYNYDKVQDAKNEEEVESKRREARRKETQERVERWRNRWQTS